MLQARLLRNEGIRAILGVKNVQQVARSSTIEAASIGGEAEARSTASSITRLGNDVNGLLLQVHKVLFSICMDCLDDGQKRHCSPFK